MKTLKRGFSAILMIGGLLFLPAEHWRFWSGQSSRWYGELHFSSNDKTYAIVRNVGGATVRCNECNVQESVVIELMSGRPIGSHELTIVPASSLGLKVIDNAHSIPGRKRSSGSGGDEFIASQLFVATEMERERLTILIIAGVALLAGLAFSVGFFCYQGVPLLPDEP